MLKILGIEDKLYEAQLREAISNKNDFVNKDAYIKLIRMRNLARKWQAVIECVKSQVGAKKLKYNPFQKSTKETTLELE